MDKVSREKRSEIMSKIRGRDTKMELMVKPILGLLGFEYQPKGIFGNPDFAHRQLKWAIFLDGCFWHGCPNHYRLPETNGEFWHKKVQRNRERDIAVTGELVSSGWLVTRIWEHDLGGIIQKRKADGNKARNIANYR